MRGLVSKLILSVLITTLCFNLSVAGVAKPELDNRKDSCILANDTWEVDKDRNQISEDFLNNIDSENPDNLWSVIQSHYYQMLNLNEAIVEQDIHFAMHYFKAGDIRNAYLHLKKAQSVLVKMGGTVEKPMLRSMSLALEGRLFFATKQLICARHFYTEAFLMAGTLGLSQDLTAALTILLAQDERYLGSPEMADLAYVEALKLLEKMPEDRSRTLLVAFAYQALKENNYIDRDVFLKEMIAAKKEAGDISAAVTLRQAFDFYMRYQRSRKN
ncbi:hypothetical protein [Emcibacter sp.]|uniref:hypothetical protein n=1 Tax=Emcibacter sp. TaxID=1979954 RepID=UPI002AA67147|nr:hypothetical protein [Emcibacter sp.]